MSFFKVSQPRNDKYTGARMYIAAPSGWARKQDGTIYRDGTCTRRSGPEMTWNSSEAYVFKTRRYAEQQAAKLINSVITTI